MAEKLSYLPDFPALVNYGFCLSQAFELGEF